MSLLRTARSTTLRTAWAILSATALSLAIPVLAYGHAVVFPRMSTHGTRESYFLRIPNEKDNPTVRIEIQFPDSLRNVAFADVPGWKLEIIQNAAQKVTGAVWTGSLEPHHYVDLPFVASNPHSGASVTWPVVQTYANGEKAEWTGAAGTRSPASVTTLSDPPISILGHQAGAWAAVLALVLSVGAMILAVRRPRLAAG